MEEVKEEINIYMRIGILTQPLFSNYGGILQNFALQKVLKDRGHEPITFDWNVSKLPLWHRLASLCKVFIMRNFGGKHECHYAYWPKKEETLIIEKNTRKFIDENIKRTNKIISKRGFYCAAKQEDVEAYIVGSDQVWRANYTGDFLSEMFLEFAQSCSIKRIAYAASFGTEKWEFSPVMTKLCGKLAKMFDLITVREESGIKLCKEYLGIEAKHVLDPTMLLDKYDYERLIERDKVAKSKGNLFYYVLDPSEEKTALIDKVARVNGLHAFTIMPTYQVENRIRLNIKQEIDKCVFPSVTSWLRAFMDAKMVICDSFHGCIFSIIFNKPFWVVKNEIRGNARFESLLKTFNLRNRLISINDEVNYNQPIDWDTVNSIRKEKAQESVSLLVNALR